jgi:DNA transformation protein
MPASGDDTLTAELLAQLAGIDRLSSRRMFGGIGLYSGALLFGIVFKDALYLRADDGMRRSLAREGGGPFRPYRGRVVDAYWAMPASAMGDKRRVRAWARRAIAACDAAAPRTPGRPRRAPKKLVLMPKLRPPRKR